MYWQDFEPVEDLPKIGRSRVMYILCDDEDEDQDTFWEYKDGIWQEIVMGEK